MLFLDLNHVNFGAKSTIISGGSRPLDKGEGGRGPRAPPLDLPLIIVQQSPIWDKNWLIS